MKICKIILLYLTLFFYNISFALDIPEMPDIDVLLEEKKVTMTKSNFLKFLDYVRLLSEMNVNQKKECIEKKDVYYNKMNSENSEKNMSPSKEEQKEEFIIIPREQFSEMIIYLQFLVKQLEPKRVVCHNI